MFVEVIGHVWWSGDPSCVRGSHVIDHSHLLVPAESNALPSDDNADSPPSATAGDPPPPAPPAVVNEEVTTDPPNDDDDNCDCCDGEGGGATELARLRTSSVGTTEGNPCTALSKTPRESTLNTPPSLARGRNVAGGI